MKPGSASPPPKGGQEAAAVDPDTADKDQKPATGHDEPQSEPGEPHDMSLDETLELPDLDKALDNLHKDVLIDDETEVNFDKLNDELLSDLFEE